MNIIILHDANVVNVVNVLYAYCAFPELYFIPYSTLIVQCLYVFVSWMVNLKVEKGKGRFSVPFPN